MAMRASSDPEVQALRNKIILKPGMKINKLTLIKKEGNTWICDCDCGTKGFRQNREYRLKNELIGNVREHCGSCGCIQQKTFKSANRKGGIQSKYQDVTYGGVKILYETDYVDRNGSVIVMAECEHCHKPFPTSRRYSVTTCGCTQGREPISLEDFILKSECKTKDEQRIFDLLTKHHISFIYGKTFQDCIDKTYLPFDFFVNNKYIIEYDGQQHFQRMSFFDFDTCRKHDLFKNKWCFSHNIPIIRIKYNDLYDIEDLLLESSPYVLTPENEKEYYGE